MPHLRWSWHAVSLCKQRIWHGLSCRLRLCFFLPTPLVYLSFLLIILVLVSLAPFSISVPSFPALLLQYICTSPSLPSFLVIAFLTPPLPPLLSTGSSDALIHSCNRRCLMVMWPKPAWQHGEQHTHTYTHIACLACVCRHMHIQTHALTHFITLAHVQILSSFSLSDMNSIRLMRAHTLHTVASIYDFTDVTSHHSKQHSQQYLHSRYYSYSHTMQHSVLLRYS